MLINDNQYLSVIESIKTEISKAQYNAALQVNKELTLLYYHIGRIINEDKSWGNKFIDNLARDIKIAYPNSTGCLVRNLKYMAKFAAEYPDEQIVQEVLAQITWYHNIALMVCDWCVNWVAIEGLKSYPPARWDKYWAAIT